MPEKLHTSSHESIHQPEHDHGREHSERLKEKHEKEATEATKQLAQEQLEAAQKKIETLAQTSDSIKQQTEGNHTSRESSYIPQKYEQKLSFTRTMTRVRKRLNVAERPLSKVIHHPVVDKVSDVAGQTVARPSGMLGGAFFSLIGTSALLWITNHYGYEYNYLAVILLFVIGMGAGLLLESLLRAKKRLK